MEPDETQLVQDSDSTAAGTEPADHIRAAKDRLTMAANGLHTAEDAGATLANNRTRDAIASCNDALDFLGEDIVEGDREEGDA